jgi:hypothetical protein
MYYSTYRLATFDISQLQLDLAAYTSRVEAECIAARVLAKLDISDRRSRMNLASFSRRATILMC